MQKENTVPHIDFSQSSSHTVVAGMVKQQQQAEGEWLGSENLCRVYTYVKYVKFTGYIHVV